MREKDSNLTLALEGAIDFYDDLKTVQELKSGAKPSKIAEAFLTDSEYMYPMTREEQLQFHLIGIEVIRRTGFGKFAFEENFPVDRADRHLITGMARLGLAYALLFEGEDFEDNLSSVRGHIETAKKELWMHYYKEEGRPRAVFDAFKSFVDVFSDTEK